MLPDSITLAVDEANNATLVDHVYGLFDRYNTRSIYTTANDVPGERDQLVFYRTFPKQNGNFRGVAKCAFKITQDITVEGVDNTTTLIAPAIVDVGFSLPVGIVAAQTLLLRQIAYALLDMDTIMGPLNDHQVI